MTLPNLLIAGVSHAGTSSLFTYLSYHPEICISKVKETHYFYPVMMNKPVGPVSDYHAFFSHCTGQSCVMEAGPGYLYGGKELAAIVKDLLGTVRLIFLLREPVSRLYSYFKYCNKALLTDNMPFSDFVQELLPATNPADKTTVPKQNNPQAMGVESGFYADYLEQWFDFFDDDQIKIIFFDELKKNPQGLTESICDWLALPQYDFSRNNFTIENKGFYYRNKRLHQTARRINSFCEPFLRKNPRIKQLVRDLYTFNTRSIPFELDNATEQLLQNMYTPYNKKLLSLLAAKGYPVNNLPEWLTYPSPPN